MMMQMRAAKLIVVLASLGALSAIAQQPAPINVPFLGGQEATPDAADVVKLSTAWSADGVAPGSQVLLAVVLDIDDGWHVQTNRPQWDLAVPTELSVSNEPPSLVLGDIQWPQAHAIKVSFFEKPLDFFSGRSPIFVRVSVPATLKPGSYPFELKLSWQACDDQQCLMPQ